MIEGVVMETFNSLKVLIALVSVTKRLPLLLALILANLFVTTPTEEPLQAFGCQGVGHAP
jgi:hypothetical protein